MRSLFFHVWRKYIETVYLRGDTETEIIFKTFHQTCFPVKTGGIAIGKPNKIDIFRIYFDAFYCILKKFVFSGVNFYIIFDNITSMVFSRLFY